MPIEDVLEESFSKTSLEAPEIRVEQVEGIHDALISINLA
jgi:hypothetical protein